MRTQLLLGRRVAALGVGLVLTACSPNRVVGQIDSTEVPIRSAFFFEQPNALGQDALVGIVLSDLPNGCDDYGYYAAVTKDFNTPGQYAGAWAAVFPEEFWETAIILRTADPNVTLAGQRFDVVPANRTLEKQRQTYARITHNKAHRDLAWFDGTAPSTDYFSEYLTIDGNLELYAHKPQQVIKGAIGSATINTATENASGSVLIHFKATYCPAADLP